MNLLRNQLILRHTISAEDDEILRILWIDKNRFGVYVLNINEKKALPSWMEMLELEVAVNENRAQLLKEDPLSHQLLLAREAAVEEEVKKGNLSFKERRDRAWAIIQPLVEDPSGHIFQSSYRGKLIRSVASAEDTHRDTILNYLRLYWRFGHKDALLPFYFFSGGKGKSRNSSAKKRGRPTSKSKIVGAQIGVNIDDERKKKILDGLIKYYEKQNFSFKTAFELMLDASFPIVGQQPTLGQAYYWYRKERSPIERKAGRIGKTLFNLKYRELSGISTDIAFGPGSLFQIDATIGDVYLVSSLNRSVIIGRPVIYVVIDTFSRLVIGFYVGLEGPSWVGAMLALEHAFNDKEDFLAQYNLLELRSSYVGSLLPQALLADRGELLSNQAVGLIQELDVSVANTAPYRPEWKPIVERRFKLIDDEVIVWLPGAVRKLPKDRNKKGNPDDAKLDIHEFRMILAHMFSYYNSSHELEKYPLSGEMLEQQVKPIPMQLWRWGIQHRSGKLHHQPRDMVRARLLPQAEASVTRDGIMFQTLAYTSPRERRERWTSRARIDGTFRAKIAYDKRTTDWIYLMQDGVFEVATLRHNYEGYKGRDWYEVEDYTENKKLDKEESLPEERAARSELRRNIAAIVSEAERLTEGDQARSEKIPLKEGREEMRQQLRAEESWQPEGPPETSSAVGLPEPETSADLDDILSAPASSEQIHKTLEEKDLDIIDQLRRRALGDGDE